MSGISTYDDALAFIHDRSGYDRGFISNPFTGDDAARKGLARTAACLALAGNPERDYPIVHVAGSKGKGSTSSFIDSMLRASGLTCGRFLSPHMHSFRERFVVDDQPISRPDFTGLVADVADLAMQVEASNPDLGQLTAWELSTAIALLWFSRSGCDVAVVEVGMGGTLDATNVVDPAVSVITRLDYEHTAILGDTLAEIARNKAGIIKPGKPAVSADQPVEGLNEIVARAADLGSPLLVGNRDWVTSGTDTSFSATGPGWHYDNLVSSLAGQHQVDNAGLAIAAIHALSTADVLPSGIPEPAIRRGLSTTFIPGRFEITTHHSGRTVVIDGAHSPESMLALANAMRSRFPGASVTVVIGMLSDKDPGTVLPPLDPIANRWIVAPVTSPRSTSTTQLASSLAARGISVDSTDSVASAIESAASGQSTPHAREVILVTGSLTTAGEAREALGLG